MSIYKDFYFGTAVIDFICPIIDGEFDFSLDDEDWIEQLFDDIESCFDETNIKFDYDSAKFSVSNPTSDGFQGFTLTIDYTEDTYYQSPNIESKLEQAFEYSDLEAINIRLD